MLEMKTDNTMRLGLLLGILVFVIAASAWFTWIDEYYVEVPLSRFDKPVLNPYDKAEKYLESTGVNVVTIARLADIDQFAANDTLIIDDMGKLIGTRQQERLRRWVEAGGHIIVSPSEVIKSNSLLGALGLDWYELEDDSEDGSSEAEDSDQDRDADSEIVDTATELSVNENDKSLLDEPQSSANTADEIDNSETGVTDASSSGTDNTELEQELSQALRDGNLEEVEALVTDMVSDEPCDCYRREIELEFDGIDEVLKATLFTPEGLIHPAMYLEEYRDVATEPDTFIEPIYWVWHEAGAMFVQFSVGEGLVSVVPETGLWRNERIAKADHAYLLSTLTGADGAVGILHHNSADHLLKQLVVRMPEMTILLAMLLGFWLWRQGRRFGPIRNLTHQRRNSLSDHLRIEPLQLWRVGKASAMADVLRTDIYQRLLLRGYPVPVMNREELNNIVIELTDIDMEALLADLEAGSISESRLTDRVKTLQRLRNEL
ncbi:Uncharacterised protein [BD1-7 clade bacterium]|uniref:DUF4350 domain-containing protein n=1 Tax=BD1-7 clade bacterium TaxID=2029982 RepID=A0A5S9Q271_9GAMM|nr:Uncharacterised protein [BD1-7 clade bacterium]CAA0112178.1 Uncharacterised protein [BD1-7 clade bacterium]